MEASRRRWYSLSVSVCAGATVMESPAGEAGVGGEAGVLWVRVAVGRETGRCSLAACTSLAAHQALRSAASRHCRRLSPAPPLPAAAPAPRAPRAPRPTCVHAHGVHVLDGADDDAVVAQVAHHLQLVLLPADERHLHQHLVGHGRVDARLRRWGQSGCGVVWCGVVWRGVVWCGVVWCGVVWCVGVWWATGRAWRSAAQPGAAPGGSPRLQLASPCCAGPSPRPQQPHAAPSAPRPLAPHLHNLLELLHVVGDAAAGAAQREGGADDERELPDLSLRGAARRGAGGVSTVGATRDRPGGARGPRWAGRRHAAAGLRPLRRPQHRPPAAGHPRAPAPPTWMPSASSRLEAVPEGGVLRPMRFMACLNSSRSSARSMEGSLAPISSTPYLSRMPDCRGGGGCRVGGCRMGGGWVQGQGAEGVRGAAPVRAAPQAAAIGGRPAAGRRCWLERPVPACGAPRPGSWRG
jgi:hypothetical protein